MKTPRTRRKPLHERQWTLNAAAAYLEVPVEVVLHYRRLGVLRSVISSAGRRLIDFDDLMNLRIDLTVTRRSCTRTAHWSQPARHVTRN